MPCAAVSPMQNSDAAPVFSIVMAKFSTQVPKTAPFQNAPTKPPTGSMTFPVGAASTAPVDDVAVAFCSVLATRSTVPVVNAPSPPVSVARAAYAPGYCNSSAVSSDCSTKYVLHTEAFLIVHPLIFAADP